MAQFNKQSIFTRKITMRQVKSIVSFGARYGQAVFFFGGAGLGKSQKIAQLANEMYPEYLGSNLCDVRLSDKEPADMAGMPIPVEIMVDGVMTVRTVYATPSFWPTDPNWCGIVFLDELTNASASCQQAAYQIMLDHKIGDYVFPKGAVFVGAGNRPGDNGATTDLLGPLVNRMTVVEIEYNATVWIEDYANHNDVHQSVVQYIKKNPDHIYTGHLVGTAGFEGPSFSSPRQLVVAGHILDDFDAGLFDRDAAEVAIQGTIGSSLVTSLLDYHVRTKRLPDTNDILEGIVTEHNPPLDRSEVDLISVLVYYCMRELQKDVMEDKYTNDEFINRTANFLKFMFENHGHAHKDMIIATSMNMLRSMKPDKPALLDMNPKRGDGLLPSLTARSEELAQIVTMYMTRFADMSKAFK